MRVPQIYKYILIFLSTLLLIKVLKRFSTEKISSIIQKIGDKKESDDPEYKTLQRLRLIVTPLHHMVTKLKFFSGTESETIDKKYVYMCLKDSNGNYYDDNTLIYVLTHEIAHAITDVRDPNHKSDEFLDTFFYLLRKAEALKIYNPELSLPKMYCGINMSDTAK